MDCQPDMSWNGVKYLNAIIWEHISYFPHIFNPTHSFNYMKEFAANSNGLPLVIDSLFRIFVGLGIYQTIQAFRRYGKL